MNRCRMWMCLMVFLAGAAVSSAAQAQSSSLYVEPVLVEPRSQFRPDQPSRLAPAVAASSFTTVPPPPPREFAVQDLVTIVIRESSQADSSASLETEKEATFEHKLAAFPDLQLKRLLEFQLANSSSLANPIEVDAEFSNEWEGEGTYRRSDSISDRITARIIDVKPNGLLVLEARKHIRNDKEVLEVVLTGTCRADDVNIDNTVLSTQLYDLRLDKQHEGELRGATKKGVITRVLEALFSF